MTERTLDWLAALGLRNYVAFDVETTGLDPSADSLIEIAAVRFVNGSEHETFSTLLSFAGELPPFITELTGIAASDLSGQPRFADVATRLAEFIGMSPVVGQNVEFDLGFLRSHAGSLKSASVAAFFDFNDRYILDTAQLARTFWPEWPAFGLASLCSKFDVPLTRAHRAADDARATGLVLAALIAQLPTRVWSELAVVLDRLMGGTTHRSASFFRLLAPLSATLAAPQIPAREAADDAADMEPITDSIAHCFGASGIFSTRLTGYSVRAPQIEMAESVEAALNSDELLVVEAPTGVGKSLAYLTPAIKWAAADRESKRQIVVSSHTKALQEQLDRKDASLLSRALGQSLSTAVLKGRNNYLCKRRLNLVLAEANERLSDTDRVSLMPLIRWAMLTQTGDINEVGGFRPNRVPHLWSQVVSDSVACAGSQCSAAKGDYYRDASDRASKATLLFVNHALLMTDPQRFLTSGGRARALIIDEAHQLESAVVSALTSEMSAAAFRDILTRVIEEKGSKGIVPRIARRTGEGVDVWTGVDDMRRLHQTIRNSFSNLAEALVQLSGSARRSSKIRLRNGDRLTTLMREHLDPLLREWTALYDSLARFEQQAFATAGESKPAAELIAELSSVKDRVRAVGEALRGVLEGANAGTVSWVEFGRGRTALWCTIYSAPIDVSAYLALSFWPHCERAVLTSATLSVDGRFDHFNLVSGLSALKDKAVRSLSVSSPFDLERQMLSMVPSFLPDPRTSEHLTGMIELIRDVVQAQARGTLILCTSNEQVDQISGALRPLLRQHGRQLLTQSGSASVTEMVSDFRAARNAVLIGASTLWEGIDVVGDALQILLVTKIPFDVPTDPWIEARGESIQASGRDPFRDYSVPVAAVRLKQGLGRLIRHVEDHGVAIITDPRLFTARYGSLIRRSLQPAVTAAAGGAELLTAVNNFFSARES